MKRITVASLAISMIASCVSAPPPSEPVAPVATPGELQTMRPVPDLTAIESLYKQDRFVESSEQFTAPSNKVYHVGSIADHWTWQYVGFAFLKVGDYQRSTIAFRRVMEIKPKFSPAMYNLACVASLSGNLDESLELLQLLATRVRQYKALKRKYLALITSDADLAAIRSHDSYKRTVALFQ